MFCGYNTAKRRGVEPTKQTNKTSNQMTEGTFEFNFKLNYVQYWIIYSLPFQFLVEVSEL